MRAEPRNSRRREGKILVLFALLLPALLGIVGLVLDTGSIAATQRQAQAGADAAATAAAQRLLEGGTIPDAQARAEEMLAGRFGAAPVQVQMSIPPAGGPFAGKAGHVEVEVSVTVTTWFVRVLGSSSQQTVCGRAVAGREDRPAPEKVCLLDPDAVPGLTVNQGTLEVAGRVAVASPGSGLDAQGGAIDRGAPPHAVQLGGILQTERMRVVGGVDVPSQVQPPPGKTASPLEAGKLPPADPFLHLPVPTTALGVPSVYPGVNGETFGSPQQVQIELVEGQEFTLAPGIYASIVVTGTGPGTLTFQPGIYVLSGGDGQGRALDIETGGTVRALGVLFYNTGQDYQPESGLPDQADGSDRTSAVGTFGKVRLAVPDLQMSPLQDEANPFHGLMFHQRRRNPQPVDFQVSPPTQVCGSTYARTAPCILSGTGTWKGAMVTGTLTVTLPAPDSILTVDPSTPEAKGPLVYLLD